MNSNNAVIYKGNLVFAAALLLSGNNYYNIRQFCHFMGLTDYLLSIPEAMFLPCNSEILRQTKGWLHLCVNYLQTYIIIIILGMCNLDLVLLSLVMDAAIPQENVQSFARICSWRSPPTSFIIHSETIDKRAVQNLSPNMEREAVLRSLNYLKDKIIVNEITTDSSTSVMKMLGDINFVSLTSWICISIAEKHPTVHHSMDVWHKAKI